MKNSYLATAIHRCAEEARKDEPVDVDARARAFIAYLAGWLEGSAGKAVRDGLVSVLSNDAAAGEIK